MHNKCKMLESSLKCPSPPVRGKIVFHETGPWCQKGWDCCSKANDVAWISASPLSLWGCSVSHCDDLGCVTSGMLTKLWFKWWFLYLAWIVSYHCPQPLPIHNMCAHTYPHTHAHAHTDAHMPTNTHTPLPFFSSGYPVALWSEGKCY